MEKYQIISRLGYGAFGELYKARDLRTRQLVAMKTVLKNTKTEEQTTCYKRELDSLLRLNHHNIIKLLDFFSYKTKFVFVFEYCKMDLWKALRKLTYPLPESKIKGIVLMILRGVAHCHSKDVIHRDLKPSNILISQDGVIKIGDFGHSRIVPPEYLSSATKQNTKKTDVQSTSSSSSKIASVSSSSVSKPLLSYKVASRFYRSPSLLFGSRSSTFSIDIWSVGCICAELFLGFEFLRGESDIDQLVKVISTFGMPKPETWPELKSFPDYGKIEFHAEELPLPLSSIIPSAASCTHQPESSSSSQSSASSSTPTSSSTSPSFATRSSSLSASPSSTSLAIRFLERIFVYSASQRPSAESLLQDEWFTSPPLPEVNDIFPFSFFV